jgi:hypothetical protein
VYPDRAAPATANLVTTGADMRHLILFLRAAGVCYGVAIEAL